jgi:osmotically-inducible protein OsmY
MKHEYGLVLLLALAAAPVIAQEPGKLGLPPTSIDLEQNNPVKAAAAAKAAAKSDAIKDAGGITEIPATVSVGDVDEKTAQAQAESARLLRSVDTALRADPRTAQLGLRLTLDSNGTIAIRGDVPSKQSRATAESIATKAAGPGRIENRIKVSTK